MCEGLLVASAQAIGGTSGARCFPCKADRRLNLLAGRTRRPRNGGVTTTLSGFLAGWKHDHTSNGVVLTLQLAEDASAFETRDFKKVKVTLDDYQLQALVRYLTKAATMRGLDLRAGKFRLWQSW
jgi:hypothetical protein